MRAILEENFRACTDENIDALMATISPAMPGLVEFRMEALGTFEDTDVYVRLDDFELIAYQPPFAVARVVQTTLPKDKKDRDVGSFEQQAYRSDTALLPQWEQVVYTMGFQKVRGKWLTTGIIERPQEYQGR
jgi:hypothetical protein